MKWKRLVKSKQDSRNAVMDRKMFRIKINVNWIGIPAVITFEQYSRSSRRVFCFSSSETFSVAITLKYVAVVVEVVARCLGISWSKLFTFLIFCQTWLGYSRAPCIDIRLKTCSHRYGEICSSSYPQKSFIYITTYLQTALFLMFNLSFSIAICQL